MKNVVLWYFSTLLLFSGVSFGGVVEIKDNNVKFPDELATCRLFHDEHGFFIVVKRTMCRVKNEYIDKDLRGVSSDKLDFVLGKKIEMVVDGKRAIFKRVTDKELRNLIPHETETSLVPLDVKNDILEQIHAPSYIQVILLSNGEIGLHLNHRLCGGGFIEGSIGAFVGYVGGYFGTIVAGKSVKGLVRNIEDVESADRICKKVDTAIDIIAPTVATFAGGYGWSCGIAMGEEIVEKTAEEMVKEAIKDATKEATKEAAKEAAKQVATSHVGELLQKVLADMAREATKNA